MGRPRPERGARQGVAMTAGGYFKIDRGVWSHPVLTHDTFSEREAWIWLISNAAWKQDQVRIGRVVVEVERGQLAVSSRFLVQAWSWSKSGVDRFLAKLRKHGMIETRSGPDATVVTVSNYQRYQLPDVGHSRATN